MFHGTVVLVLLTTIYYVLVVTTHYLLCAEVLLAFISYHASFFVMLIKLSNDNDNNYAHNKANTHNNTNHR